MSNSAIAELRFKDYRFTKIDYNCSPGFDFSEVEGGDYRFAFANSIGVNEDKHNVHISLGVRVFYSNEDDYEKAQYRLEVMMSGVFETVQEWDDRWRNNAIAIMFPYLRAMVTTLTAQSGRPAVIIPTMNINNLFAEEQQRLETHNEE